MPILFVHGVNNRASDCDYFRECGLRKEMLERLVVSPLRDSFPAFALCDDAYWGDLGARFRWGLRSVPATRIAESLGALGPGQPVAAEAEDGSDLLELLASPASAGLEVLGTAGPQPLVAAARRDPAAAIRAVAARAAVEPEPGALGGEPELSAARRAACEEEGRERARVILAADAAARSKTVLDRVRAAADDEAVLAVIQEETIREYQFFAGQATGVGAGRDGEGLEALGVGDVLAAGARRIGSLIAAARDLARRVAQGAARGASLAVLKARRERVTRHAAVFFGDVFEYLRRGQVAADQQPGTIARRVADHLLAAGRLARDRSEPLLLVTHSFGSAVAYDLLTLPAAVGRPGLDNLRVDLWAMAGSQASVFAEMRAFRSSPGDVPSAGKPALGRPERVARWLNFFDAADVFSYLAEPVFGQDAVTDVEVRAGGNLKTAHSAYFATPSFYRRLTEEMVNGLRKRPGP